jgi:amphi-Trp domain-containing protein
MAIKKKKTRDIEKTYPKQQFIDKLMRLADALESDSAFSIQISGERLRIPADSVVNIEHERSGELEEVEFQVKWKRKV